MNSCSNTQNAKKIVLKSLLENGVSATNANEEKALKSLKSLESSGIFKDENKSHELSKDIFHAVMESLGLEVSYVDAQGWNYDGSDTGDKHVVAPLDPMIFRWSKTDGVEEDIISATSDAGRVHLFSVASQYNAAEAPSPFTPPIGRAMTESEYDHTQGPLAQRTNPIVFEMVNAFLTNLGFNMMEYALPSAGKTYSKRSPIEHGYLTPTDETIDELAVDIITNFQKLEVPCYESRPSRSGESVYLMLGAAPAIGYSHNLKTSKKSCKNLQYWAYLANFTAQFKQTLALLTKYPEKEVVYHVTGTGLGVFGCSSYAFVTAFQKAATMFRNALNEEDRGRVYVQLECYGGQGLLSKVAADLNLGDRKPRVE